MIKINDEVKIINLDNISLGLMEISQVKDRIFKVIKIEPKEYYGYLRIKLSPCNIWVNEKNIQLIKN